MSFTTIPPKSINLTDIVATYKDGKNTKIIPLSVANEKIIIYDKFYEKTYKNNGKILDITFTFCPYTSATVVYFGKFILHKDKKYKNNIILKDVKNKDRLLIQLTGDVIHADSKEPMKINIRRTEAKIMTFRNAMSKYPDAIYYETKKISKVKLKDKIIYGIEYEYPEKDFLRKYSAIIGKGNGIDYIKSGYEKYFDMMYEQVIEKGGFVIPCYISAWIDIHPETKKINL